MRWERAKNLMLFFFVLLNVLLALLLYQEQRRYTLTPEREQAIRAMFARHDISWYIHFIRRFPPMRPLKVSGFDYDTDKLTAAFFDAALEIKGEGGRQLFTQGDAVMVISNGYISYDNLSGLGGAPTDDSRESAQAISDAFIAQHFPLYKPDYVLPVKEGFRFFYRETYRERVVHSNFIELLVTAQGITQADLQYGNVGDYDGPALELCAPDEALLTFIQRVRSIWPDAPILVNRMDIAYYQPEVRPIESAALHATPYYRIFIGDNEVPFMIDAYTNECIN